MERNYYMVRAMGSRQTDFDVFFQKNVVAVGWSEVNFAEYTSVNALLDAVRDTYFKDRDISVRVQSRYLNAIERFIRIQPGDCIVVPYNDRVALAVVEGEKLLFDASAKCDDLANQKRVIYRKYGNDLLAIPRLELSEGLQRRLRVPGSIVSNLYEFKEELDKLFAAEVCSHSQEVANANQKAYDDLRKDILDSIRNGTTHLQAGGRGLEELVRELLAIEGYTTQNSYTNEFPTNADADIEAVKEDAFHTQRILVQVKHHSGFSPRYGIEQIIGAIQHPPYLEYTGYFVTSAEISDADRTFAEEHGIIVMTGKELVELIIADINKLSEKMREKLGVCRYPSLLKL